MQKAFRVQILYFPYRYQFRASSCLHFVSLSSSSSLSLESGEVQMFWTESALLKTECLWFMWTAESSHCVLLISYLFSNLQRVHKLVQCSMQKTGNTILLIHFADETPDDFLTAMSDITQTISNEEKWLDKATCYFTHQSITKKPEQWQIC